MCLDIKQSLFSRRNFPKTGASSLAYLAGTRGLTAYGQTMTPMAKREPTAAERQTVHDLHTKGAKVIFQDDLGVNPPSRRTGLSSPTIAPTSRHAARQRVSPSPAKGLPSTQ
jgi:hypothetical protein